MVATINKIHWLSDIIQCTPRTLVGGGYSDPRPAAQQRGPNLTKFVKIICFHFLIQVFLRSKGETTRSLEVNGFNLLETFINFTFP